MPALATVPPPLPTLQPGVSLDLLRRVWAATPADYRVQGVTILDSKVMTLRDGVTALVRMSELTLREVERAIGAVTPRFLVRHYQAGRRGVQVKTFVNRYDAEIFAVSKTLYARPAVVEEIGR